MKSYRELDIYKNAFQLAIEIHKMSMTLPKFELYEQGSQIRRSSKSIKDNIVEGYGRKRYKADFVKYLIYAHASCDETMSQLEMIDQLYFSDKPLTEMKTSYINLSKMIYRFIEYVEANWNVEK